MRDLRDKLSNSRDTATRELAETKVVATRELTAVQVLLASKAAELVFSQDKLKATSELYSDTALELGREKKRVAEASDQARKAQVRIRFYSPFRLCIHSLPTCDSLLLHACSNKGIKVRKKRRTQQK